jgi:hypothetical protein
VPASERARALVNEVRNQLLKYEGKFHPRKRQRKPADQGRFDRMVSAIVCELAHAALTEPESWRYISLSKRMSPLEATGASFMTAERLRIINWMSKPEMDWLEVRKGEYKAFASAQTAIRATRRLNDYLDELDIQLEDFGHDPMLLGDTVVLRGHKIRGKGKTLPAPAGEPTETYREQMRRINVWLASLGIACECDADGNPRDVGKRWMYRVFNNGSLEQGGRLYGGFWLDMSNEDRLGDIWLEGEPVANLDYGQCGIRIAYGLAGIQPPPGDLYQVPGLEGCRAGVKKVLNAQLCRTGEMKRLPGHSRKLFPADLPYAHIEALILRHHQPLRAAFCQAQGLTHQFVDSQVTVDCLLTLADQELAALPVHDGLLVPRSIAPRVARVMLNSFRKITGVEGVVTATTSEGELPLSPTTSDIAPVLST